MNCRADAAEVLVMGTFVTTRPWPPASYDTETSSPFTGIRCRSSALRALELLPGQPVVAPAVELAALVAFVDVALEAVHDVDRVGEARGLQRLGGRRRALAAAADQHHRPIGGVARQHADLSHEVGIDLPVGPVLPGDMVGAHRVADEV